MSTVLPLKDQRSSLRSELKQARAEHKSALIKLEIAKLKKELGRYHEMTRHIGEELEGLERAVPDYDGTR